MFEHDDLVDENYPSMGEVIRPDNKALSNRPANPSRDFAPASDDTRSMPKAKKMRRR